MKLYIKSYYKLSKFFVVFMDILIIYVGYIFVYIIKFNFIFFE